MTLREVPVGQSAKVLAVGGEGVLRQHFLDMGLIPQTEVTIVKYAPMGDPIELQVRGYMLSLRLADAELITVRLIDKTQRVEVLSQHDDAMFGDHPGLGEAGRYHDKSREKALPRGTTLTFALVGNQYSGKTTLFNHLTGVKQHVGDFDGKEGTIKGHPDTLVTNLPSIYSLSPHTAEERMSRRFLLETHPKCVINVVDASNIERNLYLTMQLMELGIPMVLALNMMDEVKGNGGALYVNEMERELGIPVVPIAAAYNQGVEELVDHALHVARYQESPQKQDFCDKTESGGAVHRCLHGIMHLIENHAESLNVPVRFAASKIVEGDADLMGLLHLSQNEREMMEHIICQMEEERGMDRAAAMADMRFSFIQRLCRRVVVKPRESREQRRSVRVDRLLTGRYTALPVFLLVMSLVIWLSIDVLGAPLQNVLAKGIHWLSNTTGETLAQWGVSVSARSLVVNGIFAGVGMVLSFVPVIMLLFFFLSILEDSGYMARVAFVTDKLLRKMGLSGHSVVPLLMGLGCSVPAIMATRTLPSTIDRRRTILLTPFMSCSAKIPVYAFLSAAFFPNHGGLVLVSLYLLGIAVGIAVAMVARYLHYGRMPSPFVMELPTYRLPKARNVIHLLYDKTRDFVEQAFTVIFMATIVIWFLQSFDFQLHMVADNRQSMLAWMAGWVTPLFSPLGLDDWRVVTALITGFLGKESVAATMQVLDVVNVLTLSTSIPLLVFSLLYTPCVAAIAAVRRELGYCWAIYVIVFQCVLAWCCAWLAYLVASMVL